jgi:hypothetical protein
VSISIRDIIYTHPSHKIIWIAAIIAELIIEAKQGTHIPGLLSLLRLK